MKTPVVAIGLDAADPELLEAWMAAGHLPNLSKLREQGGYGRLKNLEYYKAETPWTMFLSGCYPEKIDYWTPVKFFEGSYKADEIGAYDFVEYPPFYALGDDFRVAVFDVPQTALSNRVNGLQVLAWGAHSPQTPSHSEPPELFDEINAKYGEHPSLHKDHGAWWNESYLKFLHAASRTGIERRVAICREWLRQERWDLLLTIFGEPHSIGHDLWHVSREDHPLHGKTAAGRSFSSDPVLDVFRSIDRGIGELIAAAPARRVRHGFCRAWLWQQHDRSWQAWFSCPSSCTASTSPGDSFLRPARPMAACLRSSPSRRAGAGRTTCGRTTGTSRIRSGDSCGESCRDGFAIRSISCSGHRPRVARFHPLN